MSDKAIILKVKNIEQAMLLDLIGRDNNGIVHGIHKTQRRSILTAGGKAIAIVTSFDSNFTRELNFYKIKFHYLETLILKVGEKNIKDIYESIYKEVEA